MNTTIIARTNHINEQLAAHSADFRVENRDTENRHMELVLIPVLSEGNPCRPVFHPDNAFWKQTDTEIADVLNHFYQAALSEALSPEELSRCLDPAYIRASVVPHLTNGSCAGEMELAHLIHKDFLDLTLSYHIPVGKDATIHVNQKILEKADVTEAQLHAWAMENLYAMHEFLPLSEILSLDPAENMLYVLSVKGRMYGAACMASGQILDEVSDRLEGSLIILPSSIHEVLILPEKSMDNYSGGANDLLEIVKEINATVVEKKDRLSDNVYQYTKENGLSSYM